MCVVVAVCTGSSSRTVNRSREFLRLKEPTVRLISFTTPTHGELLPASSSLEPRHRKKEGETFAVTTLQPMQNRTRYSSKEHHPVSCAFLTPGLSLFRKLIFPCLRRVGWKFMTTI